MCADRGFYLRILEPRRAAEWRADLGTDRIPILAPWPLWSQLPGRRAGVYFLDWRAVPRPNLRALIARTAARWHLSTDEVRAQLREHGFPIVEDDTEVVYTRGLDDPIEVDPRLQDEVFAQTRAGIARLLLRIEDREN